jgi:carbon-monoxide dehydrogenase large subunit
MKKFGISQPVTRKEDVRFLTGRGRYIDDSAPDSALCAVFFRSPVAHARITDIDLSEAAASPGVVAVYSVDDFAGKLENSIDFNTTKNRDGTDGASPDRPILADGVVRYAGEAIAMIVAKTEIAALDALDLVSCDFEDLDVHVETAVSGTTIHPEAPDNLAYDWAHGNEDATAEAFNNAAHTTSLDLIDNRVISNSMEPRGCFAEWVDGRVHVAFSGQGVWVLKNELAKKFDIPRDQVRVTTPDVGGGFGIKGFNYPEYFACAFAARELDRAVRWMSGRGDS